MDNREFLALEDKYGFWQALRIQLSIISDNVEMVNRVLHSKEAPKDQSDSLRYVTLRVLDIQLPTLADAVKRKWEAYRETIDVKDVKDAVEKE